MMHWRCSAQVSVSAEFLDQSRAMPGVEDMMAIFPEAITRSLRSALPCVAALLLLGCSEPEANVALGTLERNRIVLTATAAELITAQPLAEGSQVEAGQLLVQLDTGLQSLTVERLQAELQQREATLLQLRNGARMEEIAAATARADSAAATLRDSQLQLQRVEDLVQQRMAARAELDTATAQADANAARLRDASAQLDLLRAGSRAEELTQAEARLQATRAQLALEQRRLADLSIVATRSGTLDSLPFHAGERVALGSPLAILLDSAAPYARVHIPAAVRAAVVPGTTLSVHVDGSAEVFAGEVRWISQEPAFTPYYALNSSERSRLVYLAEIQLPASAGALPAGLPVQVELPQ
jgi:HlyD family secretion protein